MNQPILDCPGHNDEALDVLRVLEMEVGQEMKQQSILICAQIDEFLGYSDATNEAMQQLSEAAKSATFVLSAMPRFDDSITLKALNRKPNKRQQALQKRRGTRHYDL